MASIDKATGKTGEATASSASSSTATFSTIRRQTIGEQLAATEVLLADNGSDLSSLPRLTWGRRQFVLDDWVSSKTKTRSDAYRHGYVLREVVNGQLTATVWACKICDDRRAVKLYDVTNATSSVWHHLTHHHKMSKDGKRVREVEPGQTSLVDHRPAKARLSEARTFDKSEIDKMRDALLKFIVECNVPIQDIDNQPFRSLVSCVNSEAASALLPPPGGTELHDWLTERFTVERKLFADSLANASSRIHISWRVLPEQP